MKTTVYITTRFADADDAVMCVKDLVKGTNLEVKAEKVDNDGVPAMHVNVYGDKVAMNGFISAYKDSFANIEDICDVDPMGWTDPVDLKYYTKDESCKTEKTYTAPYYLIDGKKANHTDMISLAARMGLDPNQRKYNGVIDMAKAIVAGTHKPKKGSLSDKSIALAKEFLSRVKGPFKEESCKQNKATFKQGVDSFLAYAPEGGWSDYWAMQQDWEAFKDDLCRDGQITQKQADSWGNPCTPETFDRWQKRNGLIRRGGWDESKQGKKNEGPGAGYTVTIKDMEISDEPKVEYDENKGVFTVEANVEYEANAEGYDWSTDYVMHDVIGMDEGTFPHNPYKGVLKLEITNTADVWDSAEGLSTEEKVEDLKSSFYKGASFEDFEGSFGGGWSHSKMDDVVDVYAYTNDYGHVSIDFGKDVGIFGSLTIDERFVQNVDFSADFSFNLYELVDAVKEYLEGKGVDMDTISDESLNDVLGSWVTDEITPEYVKEVVTDALSYMDFVDANGEPVVVESKQGEARIPSDVFDITDNTKYILNNDSDGRHPVKSFVDEMAQRAYAIASNSRDYTHESVKSVLAKAKRDYWGSDMALGREYQDELKVKYPDELRKYYAVCRSQGFDFLPKDFDALESVDSDGFFGWLVSALSGKLLKFAPSDKFESKQEEADYARASKPVADAYKVLDNYYLDNGKLSDFLTEQVLMTYKNDGAMYSRSKSKVVKSHSLAWESLLATINALLEWDDETEHATKLTSEQVKNWFKANGMDYKKALKPLVDAIENQRKEWFGESKQEEGTSIPNVSSDAIHSKSVKTGYYTDNSGLCHIYVDGVEKDVMDFDKAVDAGYNLQESKKLENYETMDDVFAPVNPSEGSESHIHMDLEGTFAGDYTVTGSNDVDPNDNIKSVDISIIVGDSEYSITVYDADFGDHLTYSIRDEYGDNLKDYISAAQGAPLGKAKKYSPKEVGVMLDDIRHDIESIDKEQDENKSESKKSEKLTQKDLKQMATSGAAIDITNVSDEEAKEIRSRKLDTVAISRGTYGMNGALLKDKEGKTYVITARNSNLFYFV